MDNNRSYADIISLNELHLKKQWWRNYFSNKNGPEIRSNKKYVKTFCKKAC